MTKALSNLSISVLIVTMLLPDVSSGFQTTLPSIEAGRSAVRAQYGMVASSQPLASRVGLDILKNGGNAVDAAIAMAAMLNVTEPMMTGIGGDMFAMVYWAKTKELKGLNASGRAPRAMSIDYFKSKNITRMPQEGMDSITVPGAFDGWVTLHEKYGSKKFADLLRPAIDYAENGFPVMEKTAEDWAAEVEKLKRNSAASANYLIDGRPPRAGEIFRERNLSKTLRTLATGGRDAFYKGAIARAISDYCAKNGCLITMDDLAAQKSEWVQPISTNYRGYTVYEIPPNGQGVTALIALNILEGMDLSSMSRERYYHSLIEATKLAFADRNTYIADPKFAKVPTEQLLSKDYAAKRRALIDPDKALNNPPAGDINWGSDTTYFTVVDRDGNAVSFINSLFDAFGSGVVAGDTGVVLQNRGSGFSLDPASVNRLEPGKRPFHTIIPAMVFKNNKLFLSFGVMGGAIQAQAHVQVLSSLIDRRLTLQEAIDAPRYRFTEGKEVLLEDGFGIDLIESLLRKGHIRAKPPGIMRSSMGGGQAIMIDPVNGTLMGASDHRKDGLALGY